MTGFNEKGMVILQAKVVYRYSPMAESRDLSTDLFGMSAIAGTDRERLKPQIRFVELLEELTKAGRAKWLRCDHDPGYVRCVLDNEDVVIFECMGGKKGDERVAPREELAGVVAHHSNTTYLWLPELPSWDALRTRTQIILPT
jgi:hypothetical protein